MGFFKDAEIDTIEMFDNGYYPEEISKALGITVEEVNLILNKYSSEDYDEAEYDDSEYDDSMDGDFDSAMTSAGFGTDEDYGYYGEE